MYFVASVSSHIVEVNYARVARLLYMPGTAAAFMPPSGLSYINVTRSNATGNSTGSAGNDYSGGGGGGSGDAAEALADGLHASGNTSSPMPASADVVAVPSPQQPVSKLTSGVALSRCGGSKGLLWAAFTVAMWLAYA